MVGKPDRKRPATKRTKNPTRIERRGRDYHVYVDGRYYGWTPDKATAERMRDERLPGRTAVEDASELSLWTAWNDAVQSGMPTVFEDDEGFQLISFDVFWLVASRDKHGWNCEYVTNAEFWAEYGNEDDTLRLKFADKPYLLE
jgi:hypothetical protein